MGFLQFGDVFITSENNNCLRIKTSTQAYIKTRTVLMALADISSLPLSLHGEICAEAMNRINPNVRLITTDDISRYTNEFIVAAWKVIDVTGEEKRQLAEEIKSHLEKYDLNVIISI